MEGLIPLKKIDKDLPKVNEKLKDTNFGRVVGNQKTDTKVDPKITPDILKKIRLNVLGASYEPNGEMIDEKALSKSQQRFMGMVYAYKKGEMPNASDEVKKVAEGMTMKEVEKYASTKHAKLPEKVEEKLDKKDIPFLKDLAGKLSDGAKKHKKQSEKIKLALNTEDTAIESELVIQDWNVDDIYCFNFSILNFIYIPILNY